MNPLDPRRWAARPWSSPLSCSSVRFAWPAWLGLLLATLVGGCGPGVGGTGTGVTEGPLSNFGATPAALCSSDLAALLDCSGTGGGSSSTPTTGTGVVYLADHGSAARISLRIEGDRVELSAPCSLTSFIGEWGQTSNQSARFFGNATVGNQVALATLSASRSDAGVLIELRDAQSRTLLAPMVLQPAGQPALIRCD